MRIHPGLFMALVWSLCAITYYVLPFKLIGNSLSTFGFFIFFLFILSFVFGSILIPKSNIVAIHTQLRNIDFRNADTVLKLACVVAILACCADLVSASSLDLAEAYKQRSERAGALLRGQASNSSLAFQFAFITYPAGFIFIARRIIFDHKIRLFSLAFFGFGPVVLAMLAMGGRAPLLYAILISIFSFLARSSLNKDVRTSRVLPKASKSVIFTIMAVIPIAAFIYFAKVFLVRAEVVGGAAQMFQVAEQVWGIGFKGETADLLFQLLGKEVSYLIFVFTWYLVQGLIMSNLLFTYYEGDMQLGIYGIDLVSALMRRLDGELVAAHFQALMDLGTYGFLPSAFGSLFVDFLYGGFFVALIWGLLVGLVYQKIRKNYDARWYIFIPFITLGIIFSLINTPLGFTNGFVTHFYLVITFLLSTDVTRNVANSLHNDELKSSKEV